MSAILTQRNDLGHDGIRFLFVLLSGKIQRVRSVLGHQKSWYGIVVQLSGTFCCICGIPFWFVRLCDPHRFTIKLKRMVHSDWGGWGKLIVVGRTKKQKRLPHRSDRYDSRIPRNFAEMKEKSTSKTISPPHQPRKIDSRSSSSSRFFLDEYISNRTSTVVLRPCFVKQASVSWCMYSQNQKWIVAVVQGHIRFCALILDFDEK